MRRSSEESSRALPFFMALGLLRMARLGIDRDQNAFFFRDASVCLNAIEPHLHWDL